MRGRGVRPWLPRGGRRRRGVATRRDSSAAVAAWRCDGRASAGEWEKEPARWAGLGRCGPAREKREARGWEAGWAGFGCRARSEAVAR